MYSPLVGSSPAQRTPSLFLKYLSNCHVFCKVHLPLPDGVVSHTGHEVRVLLTKTVASIKLRRDRNERGGLVHLGQGTRVRSFQICIQEVFKESQIEIDTHHIASMEDPLPTRAVNYPRFTSVVNYLAIQLITSLKILSANVARMRTISIFQSFWRKNLLLPLSTENISAIAIGRKRERTLNISLCWLRFR